MQVNPFIFTFILDQSLKCGHSIRQFMFSGLFSTRKRKICCLKKYRWMVESVWWVEWAHSCPTGYTIFPRNTYKRHFGAPSPSPRHTARKYRATPPISINHYYGACKNDTYTSCVNNDVNLLCKRTTSTSDYIHILTTTFVRVIKKSIRYFLSVTRI